MPLIIRLANSARERRNVGSRERGMGHQKAALSEGKEEGGEEKSAAREVLTFCRGCGR